MLMLRADCVAEGDAVTALGHPVLLFSCTLILSLRFSSRIWRWSDINSRAETETDCCYQTATNRCYCWGVFLCVFKLSNHLSNWIVRDCCLCYFSEGKDVQKTKWFEDPCTTWDPVYVPNPTSFDVFEVLLSPSPVQSKVHWNNDQILPENTHRCFQCLFSCCLYRSISIILLLPPVCNFWQCFCKMLWHKQQTSWCCSHMGFPLSADYSFIDIINHDIILEKVLKYIQSILCLLLSVCDGDLKPNEPQNL